MYAKLFASLYQGTLRGCADEILVFTNLLAHADAGGTVDKHWRAISEECGISRERVEAAIANLESPDEESRSPELDGRRIVRIDEHRVWGWRIVNHGKYRAIRNEDDRREQNRLAQERWRSRKQNKPRKPQSAQAEADTEALGAKAPTRRRSDNDDQRAKLPTGWRPSADDRGHATDKGLDPESTAAAFTDYFCEGRGRSEKRSVAGWSKRFRIWCNTDAERRPAHSGVRSAKQRNESEAFALAAARLGGKEPVR